MRTIFITLFIVMTLIGVVCYYIANGATSDKVYYEKRKRIGY